MYSCLEIFDNLFYRPLESNDTKFIENVDYLINELVTKLGEILNELCFDKTDDESEVKNDYTVSLVLIAFIRKIIEQLDSINILYSHFSTDPVQLILRSLIENIVSLEYILKEDTTLRASAYFLQHHFDEIDLWKKAKNKISLDKDKIRNLDLEMNKKKAALDRIINSNSNFSKVKTNRNKILKNSKNKHPHWYENCSNKINNFHLLMNEVGYKEYYDGIYGGLSFETHGLNSSMCFDFNSTNPTLEFLRNPKNINSSSYLNFTCSFSLNLVISLYKFIDGEDNLSDELKQFYEMFKSKLKETCAMITS